MFYCIFAVPQLSTDTLKEFHIQKFIFKIIRSGIPLLCKVVFGCGDPGRSFFYF